VADRHIVNALAEAVKEHGLNYLEGIAQCKDSFYGQHDPDSMPNAARLKERWEAWRRGNVMCSEMETAALFVISSIRGCRAGAVMSFKNMADTISIACSALSRIIIRDQRE
jgi:uridine phosphorylase